MSSTTLRLAATLAALGAAPALAGTTAVGLVGERTLVMIDTATATLAGSVTLPGSGALLGIDWRPSDGALYAVDAAGSLLRIDLGAGTAAAVARLDVPLPGGRPVAMDFNPAADKLRLMTGTTNHRIDPATGKVTVDGALHFGPGTAFEGEAPEIVATAYSNARGKPEKTAQYNIDAARGALVRQVKPNDGVLAEIGSLGIPAAERYAFDIATAADGSNTGWLVADGTLHAVSLETGRVTASRPLPAEAAAIRDVTVLPAE